MLHLLADSAPEPTPQPYAEAVARLASVRHALRLVDASGGGPADDLDDDESIAVAWDDSAQARRRWFDRRTERMISAAAGGLEALLTEQQNGREPHTEAGRELVAQIRRELAEVARVVLA